MFSGRRATGLPSARVMLLSLVAVLSVSVASVSAPVSAAPASGKVFTLKATIKGASGRTLVLLSKSGRVLARTKITTNSRAVALKTPKIASLAGSSLHLIGSSGDYYGPVVLRWAGKKSATATRVSTTFGTTSTTVSLGTVSVKTKTANQGTAVVAASYSKASTPTVRASGGVPSGVGSYGKAQVAGLGVEAFAVTYNQNNVSSGADADLDGIVNAFDVNDDNDTKLDFQDNDAKPQPKVSGDDCAAAKTFSIFSNFKATDPNFDGTINVYGSLDNKANKTRIATALDDTLSFAIQRVSGVVCGGTVTKNEFRGVDVPYAPSDFVTLPAGGFDVQWTVGNGKMNNSSVTGLSSHTFTCTTVCEISGQDTFIQRVTTTNGVYEFIANPTFIFVTHPMIKSLNGTTVDYSALSPLGSQGNQLALDKTSTAPLVIELYRPQRLAIEGEAGEFLDIGGLDYFPDAPNAINPTPGSGGAPGGGPGKCDPAKQSDTTMVVDAPVNEGSPAVLTITWDMTKIKNCFDDKRIAWQDGELLIDLQVMAPVQNSGNAAQKIYILFTSYG